MDSYTLKMWIDYNAPNDIQGKTFKATIVIDSLQDVEDGYVFNSTAPIITLNKFEDGNIDQIIPLNSTFTDPGILSVKDDKDLLTQADVVVTGVVDTTTVGTYNLTYTVTDSANNTTTVERTIAVGNNESLNIKHSISDVLAMYTSEQQAANEAIFCSVIHGNDDMYLGCSIHDKVEDAFNNHIRGIVIMTSDAMIESPITIATSKDFILELNGNKIESEFSGVNTGWDDNHMLIKNHGNLVINDATNLGIISGSLDSPTINAYEGSLTINGGKFLGKHPVYEESYGTNEIYVEINGGTFNNNITQVNCENCVLRVNNGNLVSVVQGTTQTGKIEINDGIFNSSTFCINKSGTSQGIIEINGGTFTSEKRTIENYSGTINVNGGTFESTDTSTIQNYSTGTINIIQESKPIYVSSLATTNAPAVYNNDSGTINITGTQANNCTSNSADTTSGLCVYTEGDTSNYANNAATNHSSGILNINGGTYHANYAGIVNDATGNIYIQNAKILTQVHGIVAQNGIVYIKNSTISSNLSGITFGNNNRGPIINLCSTTITATNKDFRFYANASGTPTMNYSNDVVFSNNTNSPNYDGTGTVNITSNACNWQ